jgi:hypothetical protein
MVGSVNKSMMPAILRTVKIDLVGLVSIGVLGQFITQAFYGVAGIGEIGEAYAGANLIIDFLPGLVAFGAANLTDIELDNDSDTAPAIGASSQDLIIIVETDLTGVVASGSISPLTIEVDNDVIGVTATGVASGLTDIVENDLFGVVGIGWRRIPS